MTLNLSNVSQIYSHPGQPQMQVEVILASDSEVRGAPRLYTIRMRYPRIIHAEIMTHRVFSRNARSSRAVPVETMLKEIRNIPFVPWHWGKNQKGMQASEECNEFILIPDWDDIDFHGKPHLLTYNREDAWLHARDKAVDVAEAMSKAGYHKQVVNRLIEPFSWIDTLITATDWSNFLHLRQHKDAEPHLIDLANLVAQAIAEAPVQLLKLGEWHLPYITLGDREWAAQFTGSFLGDLDDDVLCRLSAARSARISYKPFDGDASYEKEMERFDLLVTSERVHASPLEHQATPDEVDLYGAYWNPHLHGNLSGWKQFRKMIPNERYIEAVSTNG